MDSAKSFLDIVVAIFAIASPVGGAILFLHNQAKNFTNQRVLLKSVSTRVNELTQKISVVETTIAKILAEATAAKSAASDAEKAATTIKSIIEMRGPSEPSYKPVDAVPRDGGRIIDLDKESLSKALSYDERLATAERRLNHVNNVIENHRAVLISFRGKINTLIKRGERE